MLSRRAFIAGSSAVAVAACPICAAAVAAEGPHWNYEEAGHWGELSPEFRLCGIGAEQSPIDLADPIPSALGDVTVRWRAKPGTVVNNGHTIQIDVEPGSAVEVAGKSYGLVQFHFHRPSEHTIGGARLAMEAHLVHQAADGGYAVLGVFLVPGGENAALAPIWAKMPASKGEAELAALDLSPLLPASRAYYRYAGSLTTPPCSETVLWTIFADPVEASEAQIAAFARLYPMNARPLQKLNRRFLLGSF